MPGARSRLHGPLARWAVALSAVFGVAIAVFLIGWTVGGDSFIDNNLWFSVTTVLPGVATAIAACATAIVALIRGERWRLLWVPLCAFPALFVFLMLGEAFWWE
ncbi:MAG TPA: hypothetical protein VHQ98_10645 [Gaiellaceae bacterium]|nr:hypothetical protein [Gaiellaceae bacterium]